MSSSVLVFLVMFVLHFCKFGVDDCTLVLEEYVHIDFDALADLNFRSVPILIRVVHH